MNKTYEHPINEIINSIQADGWTYKIEFGKSRSKYYKDAVEIAEQLPNYSLRKDIHIMKYTINEIDKNIIEDLLNLIEHIHNWKSCHFYINNIEVGHPIAEFNCYKGFLKEGNSYCFDSRGVLGNVIGCKWSGIFDGVFPKYIQWEKFGEVNDETCYLDKQKIKNIAYNNIGAYISCPHLGELDFLEKINNLPTQVNIKNPKSDIDNFPEIPDFSKKEVKIDENNYIEKKNKNKSRSYGCLGTFVLLLTILFIFIFFILL